MFEHVEDPQIAYEVWPAADLHALADAISRVTPTGSPADMLDQLDALERLKSAAAAAQVAITTGFADTAEAQAPPRLRSLGAEVGLAVRTSPHLGEQRLVFSRRLVHDLPETLDALRRGEVSEAQAFAVAREVGHLTHEQRHDVDDDLSGRVAGLGDKRLRQAVRRSCLTHAAEAEERRHRRARAGRHVTTRQLDDGTGRLVAILPLEHLAAVRGTLDRAAAAARVAGDDRTGGQVRTDTLVARLTGHEPNDPMPVRINLVIGVESLLGAGTEPGQVPGLGWLPAGLCTDLVRRASEAAKATLRRLFTGPDERALVAMESSSRAFDGLLGEFLDLRDGGVCRTPGCDAAIRHRDHVESVARSGATNASNGQGLCERCNYVKESPGWDSWVASPTGSQHEVQGVTEHLQVFRSTPPPPPGGPAGTPALSRGEQVLASYLTLAS